MPVVPPRTLGLGAYFSQHYLSQAAESRRQQQAVLECHLWPPEIPAREETTVIGIGKSKKKNHSCSLLDFLSLLLQHSCICTALKDTQSCLSWQQGDKSMVQGHGVLTLVPGHAARPTALPTSSRRLPFSIAYPNVQSNLHTSPIDLQLDGKTDNTIILVFLCLLKEA